MSLSFLMGIRKYLSPATFLKAICQKKKNQSGLIPICS